MTGSIGAAPMPPQTRGLRLLRPDQRDAKLLRAVLILEKAKTHTSVKYDEPMPDMQRLTWKGVVIDSPGG